MDIQEGLRQYGRDSRLLGGYRAEVNLMDTEDEGWEEVRKLLRQMEKDVDELERELVAAGLMHDTDRYMYREDV